MSSPAIRLFLLTPRRGASGIIATGNQGVSNVIALGGVAATSDPYFGPSYAPYAHEHRFTSNIDWLDSADSNGFPENRTWGHGPLQAPEAGTLKRLELIARRGAFAHAARGVVYADDGTATVSAVNPVGGSPLSRVGTNAGSELVIPAVTTLAGTTSSSADTITATAHGLTEGAVLTLGTSTAGLAAGVWIVRNPTANTFQVSASEWGSIANITSSVAISFTRRDEGWYAYTLNADSITANSFYWPTFFVADVASGAGAQVLMTTAGVASDRMRSSAGGTSTYNSTTAPPATWTSFNRAERKSWSLRVVYTPAAPPTPVITATANLDRSISVVGTCADTRDPVLISIEAREGAGAWSVIAIKKLSDGAFSTVHRDLTAGTSYSFRATAYYTSAPSSTSAEASATAQGIRVAFVRATPSVLSTAAYEADPDLIQNPYRGVHGTTAGTRDIGVTINTLYNRTSLNWRDVEPTLGNYTIAPVNTLLDELAATQTYHLRFRTTIPTSTATLPSDLSSAYYGDYSGGRYPKYNDQYILNTDGVSGRIQAVINWLANATTNAGVALKNDPRLSILDMGWVNRYGEWQDPTSGIPVVTTAQMKLVIDAMCNAFPDKKIIMSLIDDDEALYYAIQKPNVIGVRQDALGDTASPFQYAALLGDRSARTRRIISDPMFWRVAEHKGDIPDPGSGRLPKLYLSEFDVKELKFNALHNVNLGNADYPFSSWSSEEQASALRQVANSGYIFQVEDAILPDPVANGNIVTVTLRWRNRGNGPLPISKYPVLQLRDAGGTVVWSQTLSLDLGTLRPDIAGHDYDDVITVAGVAPGSGYQWGVQIPAEGRYPAFKLANTDVQTGTWYRLRNSVTVQ